MINRFHGLSFTIETSSQHQTARPPQGWRGMGWQPPQAASVPLGPAAKPLGWVQGRSALPGELFINSIVGQYCVSFGGAADHVWPAIFSRSKLLMQT